MECHGTTQGAVMEYHGTTLGEVMEYHQVAQAVTWASFPPGLPAEQQGGCEPQEAGDEPQRATQRR